MLFGDILRSLLEENDLTQKQLSENLHIAASTLGNYVQNLREPDFMTLKQLADYFNVSIDYLLDYRRTNAATRSEDDLLRVFRQLPPEQQEIFLAQGKAAVQWCRRGG
ncbi:MAG: helix-turn-helix domain-containing protein [Oscillospiraceae bacterium]|jgi:transcriptional regulator with XRE-family HTH domain|nr:helix-turn-helix domain-containing protein [Oscillospiraceae bacterium]